MRLPISLLAALALGCGTEPEPAAAPAVVTPQLPQVPFEDASFACCANDRIRRILGEYLDMQHALADDDLALAQAELQALRGVALDAADDDGLSGHSRGLARQVAGQLEPVAEGSLDALREAFIEVSKDVIVLAQANQGGAKLVAVGFCPTTNANWLQADSDIRNPFLGSLDLSSGAFRP